MTLVVVLAAWQGGLFHAFFNLKTFSVPYPSAIQSAISVNSGVILGAAAVSLPAAVLGYASGMALGFAIASALVRFFPTVISRATSLLSATNSLPIIALVPLIALFVDPGLGLKVIVVAVMTTPIMTVYAVRGLTNVEPSALEMMASLEASGGQTYRMVRVPTALPFIFAALKSSVVLALIGTIVSEALRGFEGLGFIVEDSLGRWNAPKGWLALIAIATIGIAWYVIIEVAERLTIPWVEASRKRE